MTRPTTTSGASCWFVDNRMFESESMFRFQMTEMGYPPLGELTFEPEDLRAAFVAEFPGVSLP